MSQDNLEYALSVVGDKWSMRIIMSLHLCGSMRFNDCQADNCINTKTLTKRLQTLVQSGLIAKHEYKEYPPRVEYELTDKGKALIPAIQQLSSWAEDFSKQSA